MKYFFIIFLTCFFIGCHHSTVPVENIEFEYFEDFNEEIVFDQPTDLMNGSFMKTGTDNWNCYIEKAYSDYEVSSLWNWEKYPNSDSTNYCIRGTTTVEEMGILWLLKTFEINDEAPAVVSVLGRTIKLHNGGSTGPGLYVFNGDISNPSTNHFSLLGKDDFQWDSASLSDWRQLTTEVTPTSNYLTVALRVRDGWNSYYLYHEFDNLSVISK